MMGSCVTNFCPIWISSYTFTRKTILNKQDAFNRFRATTNNWWKCIRDIKGKYPSRSSSCPRARLCLPSSAVWPSPHSTAALSRGWRASCDESPALRWEEGKDELGAHSGCWQASISQVVWSVCVVSQLTTSYRSVQKLFSVILQ